MKMKNVLSLMLALVMLCTILTGCGGSSRSYAVKEEAAAQAPAENYSNSAADTLTQQAAAGSTALPENRKWIITVDMRAETEDLDALQKVLDEKIKALDGYVEDQSIYNGSNYATRRYRHANLTVRIPAERVDEFTANVEGIANVVSNNLRREDVTLSYVATESRVKALETEQARLLELMEQAETMADLLEIEARLTDVRYELERHASQLRTYDNQINYATIYLYIEEVQEYTPVEEPTFLERIKTTFTNALEGVGNGIVNLTVFVIGNSPYLVIFGGLALVLALLAKRSRKINRKKKSEDQAQ